MGTEANWSARLGAVIADLASADNMSDLVSVAVNEAAAAVGASVVTLSVVAENNAELLLAGMTGAGSDVRAAVGLDSSGCARSRPVTACAPRCPICCPGVPRSCTAIPL